MRDSFLQSAKQTDVKIHQNRQKIIPFCLPALKPFTRNTAKGAAFSPQATKCLGQALLDHTKKCTVLRPGTKHLYLYLALAAQPDRLEGSLWPGALLSAIMRIAG